MATKQLAQATLILDKTTPGAYNYKNIKPQQVVTNIYLRKDGMPNPPPGEITLVVSMNVAD